MIDAVFEELKTLGAVTSAQQFSELWLGRERSYFRVLRAKNRAVSPGALAVCAARLGRTADAWIGSGAMEKVRAGARMQSLAHQCIAEILIAGHAIDGGRSELSEGAELSAAARRQQ